jgi:hypothetical protein
MLDESSRMYAFLENAVATQHDASLNVSKKNPLEPPKKYATTHDTVPVFLSVRRTSHWHERWEFGDWQELCDATWSTNLDTIYSPIGLTHSLFGWVATFAADKSWAKPVSTVPPTYGIKD